MQFGPTSAVIDMNWSLSTYVYGVLTLCQQIVGPQLQEEKQGLLQQSLHSRWQDREERKKGRKEAWEAGKEGGRKGTRGKGIVFYIEVSAQQKNKVGKEQHGAAIFHTLAYKVLTKEDI